MARKPKDIYERINDKKKQINTLNEKFNIAESELNALEKERESYEMKLIFETAKENNYTVQQVISMLSKSHNCK